MPTTSFMQLDVWKKAHQVTMKVFDLTEKFPRHQLFGVTSQTQRAAYSIPCNIAEGYGRRSPRDKARIYNIAEGSLEELRYLLFLSKERKYRDEDSALDLLVDDVSRMLRNLIRATLNGPKPPPDQLI